VTAVARKDANQYAFYRGTATLGGPPAAPAAAAPGQPNAPAGTPAESLDVNLKGLNTSNQLRQIERLQQRYGQEVQMPGVQVDDAY
jgi:hypothetical protein